MVKYLHVNISKRISMINHMKNNKSNVNYRFAYLNKPARNTYGLNYKYREVLYRSVPSCY